MAEVGIEADLVLVIGSKNSSNSQRLVERAHEMGKPAYLIDDQSELELSWFDGVETCMVTAGASAPEHLVQALIERLKHDFGGEAELRTVVQEDVSFEPPRSLKRLAVIGA